jgi:hypothetical protein
MPVPDRVAPYTLVRVGLTAALISGRWDLAWKKCRVTGTYATPLGKVHEVIQVAEDPNGGAAVAVGEAARFWPSQLDLA